MPADNRRLLLEIDKLVKEINRKIINPEINALSIKQLEPYMTIVARSRAHYLKLLFELGNKQESALSEEKVVQLKSARESYEELLLGAQAIETAIERGYLDVDSR